jgi:2-polyprenyl-3-methyl-5-hydroxy-6-metoxy-1,4-benzoquinol methylase
MNGIPVIEVKECWCGSRDLERFSEQYYRCRECHTLVRTERLPEEFYEGGVEGQFYGNDYWVRYIKEEYGHDIYEHSRNYLAERCIYWLRDILKYRLPPSETLEFGCGHGGLVFLLNMAGYRSTGADLSQWICDYGKKIFDIPVVVGSIQDFDMPAESLDMIILMDVLEHLPSPAGSLGKIASLLKKDGIIVLQTPCMKNPDTTYEKLREADDLFLEHLEPREHLFLFNRDSLTKLLKETGFNNVAFEAPLFAYDMFAFGGKRHLTKNTRQSIESQLLKSPGGRVILSLIDSYEKLEDKDKVLKACESDRAERLAALEEVSERLQECEDDRAERLKVINSLVEEMEKLKSSLSWRITEPLRYISNRLKRR